MDPSLHKPSGSVRAPFRWAVCLMTLTLSCSLSPCLAAGEGVSKPPATSCVEKWHKDPKPAGGYVCQRGSSRVIVFVNGIFGDAISTWKNSNGQYWPELVALDPAFGGADVYVHSFQSPNISTAQQIDELAGRFEDVLLAEKLLDYKEIVFVVHSMGGLVTRAMMVKQRLPSVKVPLIYFYATPTAGANIAGIGAVLSNNPQLKDMLPIGDGGYVKVLREQWLKTSDTKELNYPATIASYCAYELKNVWGVRIVEELSATYLCNRETRAVVADHIAIVKPGSATEDPYIFLKAAYLRTFGPTTQQLAKLMMEQKHSLLQGSKIIDARLKADETGEDWRAVLDSIDGRSTELTVKCGAEKFGVLKRKIAMKEKEEVISVSAEIDFPTGITLAWIAVLNRVGPDVEFQYYLRGLEKGDSPCVTVGRASATATYILGTRR